MLWEPSRDESSNSKCRAEIVQVLRAPLLLFSHKFQVFAISSSMCSRVNWCEVLISRRLRSSLLGFALAKFCLRVKLSNESVCSIFVIYLSFFSIFFSFFLISLSCVSSFFVCSDSAVGVVRTHLCFSFSNPINHSFLDFRFV
eukprot:c2842_g1_i2.p1 GENE.c2842_g1_i2~~c2842_g1_i2.p1  ORF type:complete len:143 (+),score=18.50 c2842_g1_i2:409-837(+)